MITCRPVPCLTGSKSTGLLRDDVLAFPTAIRSHRIFFCVTHNSQRMNLASRAWLHGHDLSRTLICRLSNVSLHAWSSNTSPFHTRYLTSGPPYPRSKDTGRTEVPAALINLLSLGTSESLLHRPTLVHTLRQGTDPYSVRGEYFA